MAKLGINTGTAANAGDGSALRAGGNIINANFDEIYEYFGDGTTLDADLAGKWLAVATGINTLSNIGIGTTNPWNALTVLGNASITGVTTSSGGFSGDITGTVTGNVYNTGISTFKDVLVSGASTVTGKSTFTGIGTFSSDLYVGGNLYTLGDVTYDEVNGRNIYISGIATVGTATTIDGSGINVTGVITATSFSGDGSSLSGIAATDNINTNNIQVSGISTLGTASATTLTATGYVSTGSTVGAAGSIYFPDNKGVNFGGLPEGDLQIYHSGDDSFIKDSGTGGLYLLTSQLLVRNANGDEICIQALQNGQVELYWDNSKKFNTDSAGTYTTGIHTASQSLHAGTTVQLDGGTGIVTATQYKGDGSALTGVGGEFDITSCLFI